METNKIINKDKQSNSLEDIKEWLRLAPRCMLGIKVETSQYAKHNLDKNGEIALYDGIFNLIIESKVISNDLLN